MKDGARGGDGLVYSTDHGRMCPACNQPLTACRCGDAARTPAGDGIVRVGLERKGRGGKTVTVIRGVPLAAKELTALGKLLKKRCGAGGTVKDGVIELQGDRRDAAIALLEQRGLTVRRSGG